MVNGSEWLRFRLTPFKRVGSGFYRDHSGAVTVIVGLAATTLIGFVGGAIDYSRLHLRQVQLQHAADAGVMAGGATLKLAASDAAAIKGTTENAIKQADGASGNKHLKIETTVDLKTPSVSALLTSEVKLAFGPFIGMASKTVSARSKAQLYGKMRLCILAVDPQEDATIRMQESGQVKATQCAIYSNASGKQGITLEGSSRLTASQVCSAGGAKVETSNAPIPTPQTGCPSLGDPLAERTAPTSSGCTATGLTITASRSLSPGTYCKGLKVTNGAVVTLGQGVYVIDDGPLEVDGNATLNGDYVGFYLKGASGTLKFAKESTVSLTAPKDGPLSGLLLFEDRSAPPLRDHLITSNNARRLIGTIYLPRGRLIVDAERAVAEDSAYTVIVARQINIAKLSSLVMNANYGLSDVPLPTGVGPRGGRVLLSQ